MDLMVDVEIIVKNQGVLALERTVAGMESAMLL